MDGRFIFIKREGALLEHPLRNHKVMEPPCLNSIYKNYLGCLGALALMASVLVRQVCCRRAAWEGSGGLGLADAISASAFFCLEPWRCRSACWSLPWVVGVLHGNRRSGCPGPSGSPFTRI